MTKRKMFLRMITASLLRRRSRMLIALLSIGIGATILSGLVTIYVDVPRQMAAQFRSYGANMLLLPEDGGELTEEKAAEALKLIPEEALVGAAPYRYVRLDMSLRQQSFNAAGTDFEQIQKTSPYFQIEGAYPENPRDVLIGKQVAETLGLKVGGSLQMSYKPAAAAETGDAAADRKAGAALAGSAEGWNAALVTVRATLDGEAKIASLEIDASTQTEEFGGQAATDEAFLAQFIGKSLPLTLGTDVDALAGATVTSQAVVDALNTARGTAENEPVGERVGYFNVTGILDTGGEEEEYIFMTLQDLQNLTADPKLDVMELSVSGSAEELQAYTEAVNGAGLGVRASLVKRLIKSETSVLDKLQSLVLLVTAVVLLLTMICVSTTMMAVVSERRREIGLRKALGASDNSIRAEFLGEGIFLGGLGGILGALLGFVFAQVVSVNVFGSSIQFAWWLLPITILVSMLIAAVSCLQPIRSAVAIDPAIVLKGE